MGGAFVFSIYSYTRVVDGDGDKQMRASQISTRRSPVKSDDKKVISDEVKLGEGAGNGRGVAGWAEDGEKTTKR